MFVKIKNNIYIIDDGTVESFNTLPLGTYILKKNEMEEFYLQEIENFYIKDKLYGNIEKDTKKIINTFKKREKSTSILLEGIKGAGKTLLSKKISIELLKDNIPTIIIKDKFYGTEFDLFIESLKSEVLFIFDEFDKYYGYYKSEEGDPQEQLLKTLDGNFTSKKYFIIIANDICKINNYFLGRPGRIFYHIQFNGLEEDAIKEYILDRVKSKKSQEIIIKFCKVLNNITYDILDCICEEANIYKDFSEDSLINYMNLDIGSRDGNFEILVFDKKENLEYKTNTDKNIFVEKEIYIGYKNIDEVDISDFIYDNKKQEFICTKIKDYVIKIKKSKDITYNDMIKRFSSVF